MKISCPQCSHSVLVDDKKVPAGPFAYRCPKCQATTKLGGKPQGASAPTPESSQQAVQKNPGESGAVGNGQGTSRQPGSSGRALVALPDAGQAKAMISTLSLEGYSVEGLEDSEKAGRHLDQGVLPLVVTTCNGVALSGGESLYQRINRLSPEARRRVFLVLVGNEFKTGDENQAFASLADLVFHPRDTGSLNGLLRSTIAERERLYGAFLDAQTRREEGKI